MNDSTKKRVELQTEFYSPTSLRQAISDFSKYLTGSLRLNEHIVAIDLAVDPAFADEAQRIVRELLNYALDLTLRERFSAAGRA